MRVGNLNGVIDLRFKLTGRENYRWRDLQDIKYLVVHHSGVMVDSTALEIARYHVQNLGWPGIGYHFLVHWGGEIEYVGDVLTVRYNVAEKNGEVIGICLPGDWTIKSPSAGQLSALRELLENLQFALGWHVPIVGHHELGPTACPGDTFLKRQPGWKAAICRETGVRIRDSGVSSEEPPENRIGSFS